MKSITILFFFTMLLNATNAQEKVLRIFNDENQKEVIIKEKKRVRAKTINGQKISGRITFLEKNKVLIKNDTINLNEIEKIKRNPLIFSVIIDGSLIILGTAGVLYSLTAASITNDLLALYAIPSIGLLYSGFISPNILKGYEKKQWNFEIVNTTQ